MLTRAHHSDDVDIGNKQIAGSIQTYCRRCIEGGVSCLATVTRCSIITIASHRGDHACRRKHFSDPCTIIIGNVNVSSIVHRDRVRELKHRACRGPAVAL